MNITFRHLELLNAVVVAGSISKATRLTGLSQPTISQQLAKFEEELGSQLIYRRRGKQIELTPAGEHWYQASTELLNRREEFESAHRQTFGKEQIILRFGTTPSLRGRFSSTAGQIAVDIGRFTRFEQVFALSSHEIVEMMDAHQINCAVVSASSVVGREHSLSMRPLFHDKLVWVVPEVVPEDEIIKAFAEPTADAKRHPALQTFAELSVPVPWEAATRDWYGNHLPGAVQFFTCPTYQAAVDFVAGGLTTCHCPMSLLPNLPASTMERLRFYDLDKLGRDAVFIMPRHLTSLKPFTEFRDRLCHFVDKTFSSQQLQTLVRPLPFPGDEPISRAG